MAGVLCYHGRVMRFRSRLLAAALCLVLGAPAAAFARLPDDPLLPEQWHLARVDAPGAWDVTTGTPAVIVAVLDTGVDVDHPDLRENIWTNPGEIAGDGLDNDGNGFADDVHGWNFADGNNRPVPDPAGPQTRAAMTHGTVVAGVIAAVGNNGEGVAGMAWRARIMPVRILDNEGSGFAHHAAVALRYAVRNGARVVNLSFTGPDMPSDLAAAVREAADAGVVIVAALGNASNGGDDVDAAPTYPACYKLLDGRDPIIGVAATDRQDAKAPFSNFGAGCADVAAPGADIFSTVLHDPEQEAFGGWYGGGWSGTSLAAPVVSGIVALLLSAYPSLTPPQVLDILRLSADPLADGTGAAAAGQAGVGRVNAARALQIAPSFVVAAETPEPGAAGEGGRLVRSNELPAVYYVDGEGRRRPFPNELTFFTWFEDFSTVETVSAAELAAWPLGAPMLPRPGTRWVKIQSDPKTYLVAPPEGTDPRPVLRWIRDEETARALGGDRWAERVMDVEPTYFPRFAFGPDIVGPEPGLLVGQTR